MKTKKTKVKGRKTGCANFGCGPWGFQGMSEMVNKCCADLTGSAGWSTFMKGMAEACCGTKQEDNETESAKA